MKNTGMILRSSSGSSLRRKWNFDDDATSTEREGVRHPDHVSVVTHKYVGGSA